MHTYILVLTDRKIISIVGLFLQQEAHVAALVRSGVVVDYGTEKQRRCLWKGQHMQKRTLTCWSPGERSATPVKYAHRGWPLSEPTICIS